MDEASILSQLHVVIAEDSTGYDRLVAQLLALHGPSVARWLRNSSRCLAVADDAYQEFCIDVWRGLRGFRGEASLRTWCFRVARHALLRTLRRVEERPRQLAQRLTQIHTSAQLPALIAAQLRAPGATPSTLDLPAIDQTFRSLRAEVLSPAEERLLELRLGESLAWRDVAEVLRAGGANSGAATAADVVRLRQVFSRAGKKLIAAAEARGLGAQLREASRRGHA